MDMECLVTLDDAVTALYAQLNAPSRRFAALISSWYYVGLTIVVHGRQAIRPRYCVAVGFILSRFEFVLV